MRVVHIFLSSTCPWCRRQREDVEKDGGFSRLASALGATIRVHDVTGEDSMARRHPMFRFGEGVPQMAVEADGRLLSHRVGYVQGGVTGLAKALA